MNEYRVQCTKTGRIWPRTYDNAKSAIGAMSSWNCASDVRAGMTPPVRLVEVEVTVKQVVREYVA